MSCDVDSQTSSALTDKLNCYGLVCLSCQNTSEVKLDKIKVLKTWRRQLGLLLLESRCLSGLVLLGPSSLGLGL